MTRLKINARRIASVASMLSLFTFVAAPVMAADTSVSTSNPVSEGSGTAVQPKIRRMGDPMQGRGLEPGGQRIPRTAALPGTGDGAAIGKQDKVPGQGGLKDGAKGANGAQFCTTGIEKLGQLGTGIESRIGTKQQNQAARVNTADQNRQGRDTNLASTRTKEDAQRQQWYVTLESKAGTDATKLAAVKDFEGAMEAAVKTRRAAIDAAIASFRSSVDATHGTRSTDVTAALAAFKSAVDAATATAKSSCSAGTDPATIRSTFQASVKSAREALDTARKSTDTVGSQVKTLTDTRKTAVDSAMNAFKSTMQSAVTKLRAALGEPAAPATPVSAPAPAPVQ